MREESTMRPSSLALYVVFVLTILSAILSPCGSVLAQNPSRQVASSEYRYGLDTAAGTLWRSNLDGSSAKTVASGLKGPYGLALDPIAQVLLWTNSEDGTVGRFDPATYQVTTLRTEFEEPYAIVLDQAGRRFAYAVVQGNVVKATENDLGEDDSIEVLVPGESSPPPKIAALQVDGIVEDPVPAIHGLALDEQASSTDLDASILYLGDGYGMMARRVRLADHQVDALVFDDGPLSVATAKNARKIQAEEVTP